MRIPRPEANLCCSSQEGSNGVRENKFAFGLKMAEVEDCVKRIGAYKGVTGVIILNSDGIPLKSTMDQENTVHITGLIHNLVHKARSVVRELDSQNDLTFLRLRSRKHEIMCAPENDYMLVVIQTPAIICG